MRFNPHEGCSNGKRPRSNFYSLIIGCMGLWMIYASRGDYFRFNGLGYLTFGKKKKKVIWDSDLMRIHKLERVYEQVG